MSNAKRGRLVVVSGPSGVGKGTVLKYVLERDDFVYSVSATTRNPREGEADGVNYFFLAKDKFESSVPAAIYTKIAKKQGLLAML